MDCISYCIVDVILLQYYRLFTFVYCRLSVGYLVHHHQLIRVAEYDEGRSVVLACTSTA